MTITEEPIPGEKPKVPTLPENIPVGKLTGMYVKLRDRIKKTEQRHKEELAGAKDLLMQMGTRLLDELNKCGGDSIASPEGTAYRTERVSASISDASQFRDYVIANELFDMLDWKANPTAVKDHITEFGAAPPGINLNTAFTVGVRRGKE